MGTMCERGESAGAASRTIYAAVEVSRKSWVVGLHAPNATGIGVHVIPAADVDALAGLFDRVRAGGSEGRMRRVLVIAFARKLLVALWRHATMGVVPGGARLA